MSRAVDKAFDILIKNLDNKDEKIRLAVAMQLDATPCAETSERVWGDLLLDMGGVVGHFAHHIGCTTNPMYEATALLREIYVVRAELDKEWGVLRPDVRLVVRAHRHRLMVVSKDEWHGLCLPGWQFKTDFSYRVAPASISEIGYALIECQDGKIVIDTHKFHLPMPHVERGHDVGTAA
jgi:hypothetical protein